MDNSRFRYLYEQYLNKKLNNEELQEWKAALADTDFRDELDVLTQRLWDRNDLPAPDYDRDRATAIYNEVVGISDEKSNPVTTGHGKPKVIKLWAHTAVAAVIATVILGAGLFFYYTELNNPDQQQDIAPGGNKAVLTLADGRKISLTDVANGSIAQQSGISITKTATGQLVYTLANSNPNTSTLAYNTLEIPKGGQYEVHLPDGTSVWLNASSSLKYPISFASLKQRIVELTGEAYFQVAKDKTHPFVVKTSGQEVRVLGTHFNINAYSDESAIKTTLLEGSVEVTSAAGSKVLFPGQQAILKRNELSVNEANTEEAIAWKNGYFRFNGENIESIMRKLSRWYNIEVSFVGNVKSKTFTGRISRFKSISQVLKMLGKTKVIHFKVEERRVIVLSK